MEAAPKRGGTGSFIELAMAKQDHKEVDDITISLVGVLQKFWQL